MGLLLECNTAGGSDPGVYTSPCLCFGFHFPSKCAESAIGVLQLWLRGTLRPRSQKRDTAGGSDPGVCTSPCLRFGFHFPTKCAESAIGVLQL